MYVYKLCCQIDKYVCQVWTSTCSYFVIRVDKKRDKQEKKILDSQERAFWDLHRPAVSILKNIYINKKNMYIYIYMYYIYVYVYICVSK